MNDLLLSALPEHMRERLVEAREEVRKVVDEMDARTLTLWLSETMPRLAGLLCDANPEDIAANVEDLKRADRAISVCVACKGIDGCGLGTDGLFPSVSRFDRGVLVRDMDCRFRIGRRIMQRSLAESTIGERFKDRKFDNFIPRAGSEKALARARQVAEDESERGLFTWGRPGNGKSHLLVAIFWERLRRGSYTIHYDAATLFNRLRAASQSGTAEDLVQKLIDVPTLLLDDIDKATAGSRDGELSGFAKEHLFRIIDGRYEAKRQTCVTSNGGLNALAEQIGGTTGEAIVSRLFEMCHLVEVTASDYRIELGRGPA